MAKERVDVLAYKQGLFETREQAKRGVMAGLVVAVLNGERFDKPGEKIPDDTELKLKGEKLKYVSRGGLKLEKALERFEISVEGKTTIDIGASTGGFTDVMLQNGAKLVYAVDVGTNQLAWKLRQDSRVISMEQFNFRYAEKNDFEELIVHCQAGVSRSHAVALFAAKYYAQDEGLYQELLEQEGKVYGGNPYVYDKLKQLDNL